MLEQLLTLVRSMLTMLGDALPQLAAQSIALYQSIITWAAITLSALAAVYEARKHELDFFGALVIAVVVSVGGGTLRDLLLARYPLFWVSNPVYLVTVFVVAVIAVLIIARGEQAPKILTPFVVPVRQVMRSDHLPGWVIVVDALGLGLWAYLGASFALEAGAAWLVAPVFGVMTASFGGVIRDVFFAQVPTIFRRGQLYSTSALIGSFIYVGMNALGLPSTVSFLTCVLVTFLIRIASVRFNILSFQV